MRSSGNPTTTKAVPAGAGNVPSLLLEAVATTSGSDAKVAVPYTADSFSGRRRWAGGDESGD